MDSSPVTIKTASWIGLCLDAKVSISVLLSFTFNLLCSIQDLIALMPSSRMWTVFALGLLTSEVHVVQLSVISIEVIVQTLLLHEITKRLCVYMEYYIGPSIDPCVTLYCNLKASATFPFMATAWYLPET